MSSVLVTITENAVVAHEKCHAGIVVIAAQDLWNASQAFHAQYVKDHPELLTYADKGFSGAVKLL